SSGQVERRMSNTLRGGNVANIVATYRQCWPQFGPRRWSQKKEQPAEIRRKSFGRKEMRETGLEPARLSTPDPKSGASANSATLASNIQILGLGLIPASRTMLRGSGARNEFTKATRPASLVARIILRRSFRLPERKVGASP